VQITADLQGQVGSPVFGDRAQHGNAELGRREDDRLLGNDAFDVRIHDERTFA